MMTENRARVVRAQDHRAPRHESRHANASPPSDTLEREKGRFEKGRSREPTRAGLQTNPRVGGMDFPRAHAFTPGDTAYDQSASFPGRGARGTYVPPQGGSFAWRTDEWYLAPETLMPTKGRAGASEHVHDPSSAARVVGSALTAPLVAAPPVRAPPGPLEPSPGARGALPGDTTHDGGIDQAVPGRVPGVGTPGVEVEGRMPMQRAGRRQQEARKSSPPADGAGRTNANAYGELDATTPLTRGTRNDGY